MIGYLRGQVLHVGEDLALIDCQGVGYEFLASSALLSTLQVGDKTVIWIYTHVREDALTLYGFANREDKEFYLQLLKVNGVGPKMALNIMSGGSAFEVASLIENEDVKALSKIPKVGKKTAEQIILTLKGKLVLASAEKPADRLKEKTPTQWRELASALVNLGFRPQEVDKVVGQLPKELNFEGGFRQALASLSQV